MDMDKEGLEALRQKAEQGDIKAQCDLGDCYSSGDGVERNYSKTVKWYRKAAEQGDAQAQFNLGLCYWNGEGVVLDYEEALYWYRRAADQGLAQAQYTLFDCYKWGRGVKVDYEKAEEWRKKVVENINDFSYTELYWELRRRGETKRTKEEMKVLRQKAETGDADAQYELAERYEYGLCVEQDSNEAEKWRKKAIESGYEGFLPCLVDEFDEYIDGYNKCIEGEIERYLEEDWEKALEEEESKIYIPYNQYEDDDYYDNRHYGEYAGSYAQDVEGLSDEFIDDVLDGDPDAYWNID